jgi:hypothetical protein
MKSYSGARQHLDMALTRHALTRFPLQSSGGPADPEGCRPQRWPPMRHVGAGSAIPAIPGPSERRGPSHMRHMATCESWHFAGDGQSLARPGMLERGLGSHSFASLATRSQVVPSRWLRRLSDRRQRSTNMCRNATSARLLVRHDLPHISPVRGCAGAASLQLLLHFLELCPSTRRG